MTVEAIFSEILKLSNRDRLTLIRRTTVSLLDVKFEEEFDEEFIVRMENARMI